MNANRSKLFASQQLLTVLLVAAAILLAPLIASTQTKIPPHKNKYSVEDDVKLGRQAAAEVGKRYRILRDSQTSNYVQDVGRRLVDAIPPEFQQPAFEYTFSVVEAKDINAFALPGGPMFVQTGMILAAKREGEMAGVMGHEIAHVALRHATAQATKAAPYQTLGQLGAIGGVILGGALGSIVGQGAQAGAGMFILKYSREYETEADILGSQIMARAGYDPRDLSEMFRTIEATSGGSGGPQWMSSHPNPGNRYQRIEQEAKLLRVTASSQDDRQFQRIRSRLSGGTANSNVEPVGPGSSGRYPGGSLGRPARPSNRYRTYSGNDVFSLEYPDNWRELPGQGSIWFAPEGGFGEINGREVHTHGVLVGVARSQSRNLDQATREFIRSIQLNNRDLRQRMDPQRVTLSGRDAIYIPMSNVSEATGALELVEVITTRLRDGSVLYVLAIAPDNEMQNFRQSFQRVSRSIQIRD
jgi:Zn-dependent protease with chaperone function